MAKGKAKRVATSVAGGLAYLGVELAAMGKDLLEADRSVELAEPTRRTKRRIE